LGIVGNPAQVSLFVGNEKNNQILYIFHSYDLGNTYQNHGVCTVIDGYCSFSTQAFSYFTLADAIDDTPDAFSFS